MPFLIAPVAGLFGGGFIAQLLVGTALLVGGTLLNQALAPKPAEQKDPGVSLTVQVGGENPLSFIVGKTAVAGHRAYTGAWGQVGQTPNAYYVDVLEISNVPVDGLNAVYVNGERATLLTGSVHSEYGIPMQQGRKGGVDHLWVKFYDGRQTTADGYLVSKFSGLSERPYTSDMVGRGTSYAIVTTRYNRELWTNGAPSMLFEVRGMRCYDIRKDSTAGGSGTQRRNDPATWAYTDNPYVIGYHTAFMGVYVGDEWVWGLQNLPAIRLPTSAWVAAMNEADKTLGGAWDGQVQFTVGGEITVDMEPAAVLEELAKSSVGRFIESGGSYKPRCGIPGAAVWSFGVGEMLITDPRTITPFPGLEQTHNYIEAVYSEPAEAWGQKPAPAQTNSDYVAADGNRKLPTGLTLPMVNRNEQAQRLAYTYLEDGRRFRILQASFHPLTWLLEPGDVIEGTILSEGYSNKKFEILEMSGRRTFVQVMTIREVDPDDFDPPSSALHPWAVGPIQTIYPPPQVVTGWAVSPYEALDSQNRARRPGIQAFYQGGMDDIRAIKIMIRLEGATDPFFSQEYPYDENNLSPSVIIVGDFLLPNEDYEVASIFVPYSGRDMAMSDWIKVTAPNIKLSPGLDFDPFEGSIGVDSLDTDFAKLIASMRKTAREMMEAIQNIDTHLADQGADTSLQFTEVRKELAVSMGEMEATFEQTITLGLVPLQNEVVALADWLTALSAGDGTDVSTARFRMTAQSGPSGYSRIGAETRVDTADPLAWRGASWFLDTPTDPLLPTRFSVYADQFVVVSADDIEYENPLVFDSGGLRLNVANIGLVRAGRIESADGKSFWDLQTGAFRISA